MRSTEKTVAGRSRSGRSGFGFHVSSYVRWRKVGGTR